MGDPHLVFIRLLPYRIPQVCNPSQHFIGAFHAAEAVCAEVIGPDLHGFKWNRFPVDAFPFSEVHFAQARVGLRLELRTYI
jgi:hypothetical protein